MPVVAIAGGTSTGLGRALTVAILESTDRRWTPVILSRSDKRPPWLRAIDADGLVPVVAVDYTSVASIREALCTHKVHTLLSVALAKGGAQNRLQLNLVEGARKAGVQRYAPSYWGLGVEAYRHITVMRMGTEGVWEACEKAQRETGMQCARFNCGGFMNYFGIGAHPPARQQQQLTDEELVEQLRQGGGYAAGEDAGEQGVDRDGDMADGSGCYLLNPRGLCAEVPLSPSGGYPRFTTTTLRDVGKFVAAALELKTWEGEMNIVGDTVRLDEMIRVTEALLGKKLAVETISPAELDKQIGQLRMPDDFMKLLWLELKREHAKDEVGNGVLDGNVNRMCPHVKPVSFKEYMHAQWS